MYINNVFYAVFLGNEEKKVFQKPCAKEFLLDLYALHQKPIEMDLTKQIFSYETLSLQLLQDQQICTIFRESDSLFFPSWGYVYDEHYAVPELHLKNALSYPGAVMDIRDAGILCVYYAIHIMIKMPQKIIKNHSVCCSIENQFNHAADVIHMPEVNYVGFLSCSTSLHSESIFNMISCDIFYLDRPEHIVNFIDQLLLHHAIANKHYIIYFKNNITWFFEHPCIAFIPYAISSGFVYFCLNHIAQKKDQLHFQYIFLVECDAHTKKCAVLFCERIKK